MKRRDAILGLTFVLAAVAGVLDSTLEAPVAVFAVSGLALGGLAWTVSVATESVGARFGPAATGVLQSTLGNLPELFIVLFALQAGEVVVAQTSILGSIFSNALLVLGLAVVAGTRRARGEMRFRRRLPNDTATLLLVAVFVIVLLGVSSSVGDAAADNAVAISVVGAVVLLGVYGTWVLSYLKRSRGEEPAIEHAPGAVLSFRAGVAVLAVAGVAAALVSDWFIEALAPAVETLGISRAFTGLVIVAIAGNAVENVVGIVLAAKGQADLAISVVKNSVAQIAAFLFPVLVLASLFFAERLTFTVAPLYVAALAVAALAIWQITGDGEATVFEGWALVGLYVILATIVWFE